MTQATDSDVLNRLDKLTAAVESLAQGLQETRVFQAQTTERLISLDQRITELDKRIEQRITDFDKRIDQRLERIEKRLDVQEGRVWTILLAVFTASVGVIVKLVAFPNWPGPAA
ncbi:MAG: hypothetical protein IGQ88_08635 [Gloeomargaritaceae cyanobacterium C42_A2020_066]|nr:hypothetical protein [Gloeomargaritaceae cyanobacterium C42_A2020_066]